MHGDKSVFEENELNHIGGMEPVQTTFISELGDKLDRITVPSGIKNDRYANTLITEPEKIEKRIPRNTLIHKFSNREIAGLYENLPANTFSNHDDLQFL